MISVPLPIVIVVTVLLTLGLISFGSSFVLSKHLINNGREMREMSAKMVELIDDLTVDNSFKLARLGDRVAVLEHDDNHKSAIKPETTAGYKRIKAALKSKKD
jgi:hypothetical protein